MSTFEQPKSQALPVSVNHHISTSYETRSNQRFWQEEYMPVGSHRAAVHVIRPASRSRRAQSQEGYDASSTRGVCGQQHHLWHRHPRPRPATPIPPSCSACSVLAMSVGAYILMYRAWVTLSSCALTMPTDSPRPTARPRRHLR